MYIQTTTTTGFCRGLCTCCQCTCYRPQVVYVTVPQITYIYPPAIQLPYPAAVEPSLSKKKSDNNW